MLKRAPDGVKIQNKNIEKNSSNKPLQINEHEIIPKTLNVLINSVRLYINR